MTFPLQDRLGDRATRGDEDVNAEIRRQFQPCGGRSLLRLAGGLGGIADPQGAGLDLGVEGGGVADDVAVELVVVLAVDLDPHLLARVMVDLVILLGPSGHQPQRQLDPVMEPVGGGDIEVQAGRRLGLHPGSG